MVLLQLFDSLILQGIESPQVSGQHLAVQTLITDRKILRTAWFCLPRIYILWQFICWPRNIFSAEVYILCMLLS